MKGPYVKVLRLETTANEFLVILILLVHFYLHMLELVIVTVVLII